MKIKLPIIALLYCPLIFIPSIPSLFGFFVADDFELINAVRLHGPFGVFSIHSNFVRPIISLSFYIDYAIWGVNPFGYKLTNLLLHLANATLVFIVVREMIPESSAWRGWRLNIIAALTGAIFAVMPSHAESVAWISGRTDLIATFWALCAWWAFLRFSGGTGKAAFVVMLLFFTFALFSKEAVITLPLIMGAYTIHILWKKQTSFRALRAALSCAAILVVYAIFRLVSLQGIGGYGESVHLNLKISRLLVSPFLFMGRAIWPCCWPAPYFGQADPLASIRPMLFWYLIVAGVFIAAAMILIMCARGNRETIGLLLFLLAAAVIAQLPSITIGFQAETRIGERLVYFPSIFIAALLGIFSGQRIPINRSARMRDLLPALILLGVYSVSFYRANTLWYQAGEIARNILRSSQDLVTDSNSPVQVILPDHLNGALIFRSGFQQAVELLNLKGQFKTIGLVTLESPNDQFSIQNTAQGHIISSENPRNRFVPEYIREPGHAATISPDRRRAYIRPSIPFAYYSFGKLNLAPPD